MAGSKTSPAMQQFLRIHAEVPDAILFFRMGDFYEVFYEDAVLCNAVLGITLTSRNKNDPNPVPMAGVPFHSAESYIAQLIAEGHSVAVLAHIRTRELQNDATFFNISGHGRLFAG